MPVDFKVVGKRIKKAREDKRLTQAQLGQKLSRSVTATAISLYEKGLRDVGIDVLDEISSLLNVPFEYLVKGSIGAPTIAVALRADKDLQDNTKAQEQIVDFVDFIKNKVDVEKNIYNK